MNKTQWQNKIRAEVAQMKADHRAELKSRNALITQRWKEGFAALKQENDRMQAEVKEWNELDNEQILNYYRENIVKGEPY